VTSDNGETRFYNQLSRKNFNAKNLIPPFIKEPVLNIDHTTNKAFVLLTFERYLVLIPTLKGGKSAFDYCFRKKDKPQPIFLRVSLRA